MGSHEKSAPVPDARAGNPTVRDGSGNLLPEGDVGPLLHAVLPPTSPSGTFGAAAAALDMTYAALDRPSYRVGDIVSWVIPQGVMQGEVCVVHGARLWVEDPYMHQRYEVHAADATLVRSAARPATLPPGTAFPAAGPPVSDHCSCGRRMDRVGLLCSTCDREERAERRAEREGRVYP